MEGVSISYGEIVAVNAIVTKDVDAYAIMADVPARTIRKRFSDAVISRLEAWIWWDLPTDTLRKITPLFNKAVWTLDDVNQMILLFQGEIF